MYNVLMFIDWLRVQGPSIIATLISLIVFLEALKKAWPTKDNDGFITKCGKIIDWFFKWIPSNIKKPK